MKKTK